jgi:hypothetical protein
VLPIFDDSAGSQSHFYSKYNILAMRMGPGPHLKGLTLAEGLVKPEEVLLTSWPVTFPRETR